MRFHPSAALSLGMLPLLVLGASAQDAADAGPLIHRGERVDPATYGAPVIESLLESHARSFDAGAPTAPHPNDPAFSPAPDTPTTPGGFLGNATTPELVRGFESLFMGAGTVSYFPAHTDMAVGPDHVMQVAEAILGVYDKSTGAELLLTDFDNFQPGTSFRRRVVYDPHAERWITACKGDPDQTRIYLAVSLTSDPLGDWFKTDFLAIDGVDSGCGLWYPTLGIDEDGIHVSSDMTDPTACGMTIWAIDKAPLVDPNPSLGAVTAFRGLQNEGAAMPTVTWDAGTRVHFLSPTGLDQLRVRRVDPPIANPTLVELGFLNVDAHPDPLPAPAAGSVLPVNTSDNRIQSAICVGGRIWASQGIDEQGRSAARWYSLDSANITLLDSGTVSDPVTSFFYPSIAANAAGDVVMGFSGSHADQFIGAYYTGRFTSDPAGEMATPVHYRWGWNPTNSVISGTGLTAWGYYSATVLDPSDEATLWTVQTYSGELNFWRSRTVALSYEPCPDPESYCATSPNSVGPGMTISSIGSTSVAAQDFGLTADDGPVGQLGVFYYGGGTAQLPFGDGLRCVDGGGSGTWRLPIVQLSPQGDVTYLLDWTQPPVGGGPGAIDVNETVYCQFWYRDPAASGAGFNLSDGLRVTFCP